MYISVKSASMRKNICLFVCHVKIFAYLCSVRNKQNIGNWQSEAWKMQTEQNIRLNN